MAYINKERNKYIGEEGLENARYELLEFEKKYGKKLTSKSKGMNTMYITAQLGKWNKYGINNWDDLLNNTFNPKDT